MMSLIDFPELAGTDATDPESAGGRARDLETGASETEAGNTVTAAKAADVITTAMIAGTGTERLTAPATAGNAEGLGKVAFPTHRSRREGTSSLTGRESWASYPIPRSPLPLRLHRHLTLNSQPVVSRRARPPLAWPPPGRWPYPRR
ncbi:hypothetical protein BIW11_11440 [Tropilaelaps mercedesae]|uniref:Uncharacterized protein n=1 Tax=Tropilaelaps mercedesae TaxID=418985 RepID=A0A1V9XBC4_9ACAR|nr:hypothetical protein BIW11_11440 [Tropilaelaps mercedesae]